MRTRPPGRSFPYKDPYKTSLAPAGVASCLPPLTSGIYSVNGGVGPAVHRPAKNLAPVVDGRIPFRGDSIDLRSPSVVHHAAPF